MSEMSGKNAFSPTWGRTMTAGVFFSIICAAFSVSDTIGAIELDFLQNVSEFCSRHLNIELMKTTLVEEHSIPSRFTSAFVFGIFGMLISTFVQMAFALPTAILAAVVVGVFGQGMILGNGYSTPWPVAGASLLITVILTSFYRYRLNRERLMALRIALSGRMERKRIEWIVQNPRVLEAVPSGKVVSIMFLDIVGFSQTSERLTPHQAFMDLKSIFDLMRSEVLKHGGMVDKTLGDGMLAYFGYGFDGVESSRAHADAALICAISIQRAILDRNLEAAQQKKAIYPLRIGINTSSVFIGNVGDHDYFDFTVIGNGVNLAKRFEASCQHYSVMLGASTYDLLVSRENLSVNLTRKLIPIKHSEAPYEAYECDAFEDRQADIRAVTEAFRRSLGIERKDTRWPIPLDVNIYLESRYGRARLNDFSFSGISALLPMYIGNGVGLDLVLMIPEEFQTPSIGATLIIHVEVRWGRSVSLGYLHGLMITNLSVKQKEELVEVFRSMVRKGTEQSRSAS